jgi:hypothetical protein
VNLQARFRVRFLRGCVRVWLHFINPHRAQQIPSSAPAPERKARWAGSRCAGAGCDPLAGMLILM